MLSPPATPAQSVTGIGVLSCTTVSLCPQGLTKIAAVRATLGGVQACPRLACTSPCRDRGLDKTPFSQEAFCDHVAARRGGPSEPSLVSGTEREHGRARPAGSNFSRRRPFEHHPRLGLCAGCAPRVETAGHGCGPGRPTEARCCPERLRAEGQSWALLGSHWASCPVQRVLGSRLH